MKTGWVRPLRHVVVLSVFSVTVACQQEQPAEPVAVETSNSEARPTGAIVGGRDFSGLPAVGAFARKDGRHWCTGTVIAPRAVLTAAHCLAGLEAGDLEFRIGPDSSNPSARFRPERLVPHPRYASGSFNFDIGVVVLSRDAGVAPMKLSSGLDATWIGRDLFFVGYGLVNGVTRTGAGRKRAVSIPIDSVSQDRYGYRTEGKNTCTGDSGGPAFWQSEDREWLITGVVSHGDLPCLEWGVNTRADAHLEFLDPYLPEEKNDSCGSVSFQGQCDGRLLRWCEDERLNEVDCESREQICDINPDQGYYDCFTPEPEDPCDGETITGRCEGQVLVWCEDSTVKVVDCAPRNQTCVYDSERDYYNCLSQ
ncbi:MAG: trypsin-like serine protease [Myxococcota bacterium]